MTDQWKSGPPPSPGWYIASTGRGNERVRYWWGRHWSAECWIGDAPADWAEARKSTGGSVGVEWLCPVVAPTDEGVAEVCGGKPMILPADPAERKGMPITTGVLDYFPLAMAEVSRVSKAGNDQHNPGQPLHWARGKSTDHADCIPRHLIDRGSRDSDGQRHTAKLAWRALALLQTELENEQ